MTTTSLFRTLAASFVLLASGASQAFTQTPSPAAMLDAKLAPKFDDVNITIPSAEELKGCTVKLIQGDTPKSSGWLLSDAKGQPLRRFFDSNGDSKVDVWTYYKDGIEVYREFDSSLAKGTPNNFRWLNGGGMKWGVGAFEAKSGKWTISAWRMISAEEVGFEAFQAVAKNDYARLEALLISNEEMQVIKLPASKMKAIDAARKQTPQKFAGFVQTAKLAGGKFDAVEGATPSCDTTGDVDVIKFPSRAVRYLEADKHKWMQTNEMIQVGMAWRLIDAPGDEKATPPPAGTELEKLLNLLAELDKMAPPSSPILSKDAKVEAYYRKRIDLVSKIIPLDKESEREGWYKQLFDNMTAMAQNNGDDSSIVMLTKMKDNVEADVKTFGTNLAGYGAYREMWTRYAVGVAKAQNPPDDKLVAKLTEKWLDDLAAFATKYDKADDTPDALWQLSIGCEFAGKTAESKRWYKQLGDSFPQHYHAPRAKGSLDRLNLVGNKMTLSAPLLTEPGKTFNLTQLEGKVVIVHYWSISSSSHTIDLAILKQKVSAAKNVELVCINLDDDAAKARDTIAKAQVPGVHLWQAPSNNAAGLGSPLATQYGIHILPTLFLIDSDGRVANNALQVADIDTELKRVQK